MRKFKMKDVEKIEKLLSKNKTVEIEWHTPYQVGKKVEIVKAVSWDGLLIYTSGDCIRTDFDMLIKIREIIYIF